MAQRPDALKYIGLNWFALVMGLAGLSLAWGRAMPVMGDVAGAGALVLAAAAALVFLVLLVLSWMRWQRYPEVLAAELAHPVRHAFVATIPVSMILLATCGVSLLGTNLWLAMLWWAGSVAQFVATLWVLTRWLSADKATALSWAALTPALFVPVVGNVLAPLAGGSLNAGTWAAAQFGLGLLLWPVVLGLIFARIATQGLWAERLLPITFICVAPPSVVGSAVLQMGGPAVLAVMCWGAALFFLLWSLQLARRMLAQPFSMAFWSLGFPLAAFASLTLRLAVQFPAMGAPAIISLALATLVVMAMGVATWKGWREGSLLQPESVAILAVGGNDQPPGPR
ncbi:C4-dicarboxylate ABC transporter [Ottowia thiooxydans]|uniref:SLAC1 family transporter n=1 Tax=Ottowia thiooxydans TaxID=219182 RepID=UPI0004286450|nr:C4-dicarboxylate ABC transporter [Ottowia thiooxydans]